MSKLLRVTIVITSIYILSCIISIVLMKCFEMRYFRYGFGMSGFLLVNPIIPILMIAGFIRDHFKKAWTYILCFVMSFVMWFIYLMVTAIYF